MRPDTKEKVIIEKYRAKLGCKNEGKVCWCEVCCTIDEMIKEIKELCISKIKQS